jgi:hypothetical protein
MSTVNRRQSLVWILGSTATWPLLGQAAEPALELEGVKFEPTVVVGGKTIVLNGAAVSNILSTRTTVVALYLSRKHTTPEGALAEPGAKRLCFYSLREVSAKDLSNTFLDRLRQNATSEEIAGSFIQIAQFGSAFSNRAKLNKGDFVVMDFNPTNNSTEMTLNGQRIGSPRPGESFFRCMMKIWMGPKVRPATRKGLLGEPA